jgi:hypothetical protein
MIRRIAPAALAVGIGLGAAGTTASAAGPSAETTTVAPAAYGGCTTTSQWVGGGGNPSAPYNSSEPSFFFSFFVTSFTCTGPNGVAQRDDFAFFGSSVTLNGQFVQTADFSDAFVRRLAGLAA